MVMNRAAPNPWHACVVACSVVYSVEKGMSVIRCRALLWHEGWVCTLRGNVASVRSLSALLACKSQEGRVFYVLQVTCTAVGAN